MRYLFKEVDLNKKKEKLLNIYKDIIKKIITDLKIYYS